MKRIGIILRDYKSESKNNLYAVRDDLIVYLRKQNIEVICIPVVFENNIYEELERVKRTIAICNGIILPGGANEHEIDLEIVKYLYQNNIPTLGICLGMQLMSLTFEGDIKKLSNNKHQSRAEYVHEVMIKEDSRLAHILKENKILVNSRHSEHITTTNLNIVAIANDLTIEAVEDPNKKFFIGVQWHPESLSNDIYSKRLFDYFIKIL